jgi:aminopeptidase N
MAIVDVDAVYAAREAARAEIGSALMVEFTATYQVPLGPYRIDGASIGRRALRNASLAYIAAADQAHGAVLAKAQFDGAANMTDALAALAVLADLDRPERVAALAHFFAVWSQDPLVVDKWFSLQARSSLPDTPARVRALTEHPAYDRKNPNRVRSLIGAFSQGNQVRFHDAGGSGYVLLADEVLAIDPGNPTTAARLVQPLCAWRRQDAARQALMQRELERILATPDLSKNTYEMVAKSLG